MMKTKWKPASELKKSFSSWRLMVDSMDLCIKETKGSILLKLDELWESSLRTVWSVSVCVVLLLKLVAHRIWCNRLWNRNHNNGRWIGWEQITSQHLWTTTTNRGVLQATSTQPLGLADRWITEIMKKWR